MGHIRVVITGNMYGQTVQNVLHLLNHNDAFTLPQIAADIKTAWVDRVSIFQNSNLRYTNILVQDLSHVTVQPFSLTIDRQGQGFNDTRIPPTLTYVIKLQTAVAGRHGRGRVLLSGVQSDSIQGGFLTASAINSWNTTVLDPIRSTYLSNVNNTLELCVRAHDGTMNPVISIQLRGLVGTLRRRQFGVGV